MIWIVAALTMILGNVVAVVQPNIKRMLLLQFECDTPVPRL
jgi:NADH:ubiquinone oxidoreductase subunit 2 (subunit N)